MNLQANDIFLAGRICCQLWKFKWNRYLRSTTEMTPIKNSYCPVLWALKYSCRRTDHVKRQKWNRWYRLLYASCESIHTFITCPKNSNEQRHIIYRISMHAIYSVLQQHTQVLNSSHIPTFVVLV